MVRLLPRLAEANPLSAWTGQQHSKGCNASPKLLEEKKKRSRKGGWVGSEMQERNLLLGEGDIKA